MPNKSNEEIVTTEIFYIVLYKKSNSDALFFIMELSLSTYKTTWHSNSISYKKTVIQSIHKIIDFIQSK